MAARRLKPVGAKQRWAGAPREQGRQGKVLSTMHGYRSLEIDIDDQLAELVRASGRFDEAIAVDDGPR